MGCRHHHLTRRVSAGEPHTRHVLALNPPPPHHTCSLPISHAYGQYVAGWPSAMRCLPHCVVASPRQYSTRLAYDCGWLPIVMTTAMEMFIDAAKSMASNGPQPDLWRDAIDSWR